MLRLLARMREDIRAVKDRDPAARNGTLEIMLTTPGLHAQWAYRLAHPLWLRRVPLLPRLISHYARFLSGIEIHPGATIGRRLVIDHGMGVVIGETAVVGDDVLLYQGVTLGGTALTTGRRHPTIGNRVHIGAGASVLGDITVGDGARIGSGAVVVQHVPAGATVGGVPARILRGIDPESGLMVRPVTPDELQAALRERIDVLEARIGVLERSGERCTPAAV